MKKSLSKQYVKEMISASSLKYINNCHDDDFIVIEVINWPCYGSFQYHSLWVQFKDLGLTPFRYRILIIKINQLYAD